MNNQDLKKIQDSPEFKLVREKVIRYDDLRDLEIKVTELLRYIREKIKINIE